MYTTKQDIHSSFYFSYLKAEQKLSIEHTFIYYTNEPDTCILKLKEGRYASCLNIIKCDSMYLIV